MGEQPPFAGLGKLYFCRVEDKDKEPTLLGEAVTLKPGMLTYKDEDPKNEYSAKGYSIGFNATMEEPSKELLDVLNRPTLFDVKLERKPSRMPRKMKKAYRSDYPRNTKWTRKVANYLRRMSMTMRRAETVITKEQHDRLSEHIEMTIRGKM